MTEILTEICMDFNRNFIFWPKFWPTLVRRKNCGRNFFLTDRSKYCDRHFDRLTSVKIKIWPRFLTEKSVKKNYDRILTAAGGQNPPFDRFWPPARSKLQRRSRRLNRKSKILTDIGQNFGQNFTILTEIRSKFMKFDRFFGQIWVKIVYFDPHFGQNSKLWPPYRNFDRISVKFRSKNCRRLFRKDTWHLNQLPTNFYNNAEPIKIPVLIAETKFI